LSATNQALTTRVSELEDEINNWLTITPDLRDLASDQWAPCAQYVETGQTDVVGGLATDDSVLYVSRANTSDPEIEKGAAPAERIPANPYAETYQG
jgi:hypothetical protein